MDLFGNYIELKSYKNFELFEHTTSGSLGQVIRRQLYIKTAEPINAFVLYIVTTYIIRCLEHISQS